MPGGMVSMNADLSGIGAYVGAIRGTLEAQEAPAMRGQVVNRMMTVLKKKFMTDAVAANMSGFDNLSHVFEWGEQDVRGVATGRPSNIPLFRLTKHGDAGQGVMSYQFLPSTKPVPLPDPERYGFKPEKLQYLRRHVFQMKALVMETQGRVQIAPRHAKKLFIPDANTKYGYYMTSHAQTINPGGEHSTGGFARFWNAWFDSRADDIVHGERAKAEEVLAATGQNVLRYVAGTKINGIGVGGRFASREGVTISYVDGKAAQAKAYATAQLEQYYGEEEF